MDIGIPPYKDMLEVTLRVLISLGGSASIDELDRSVIQAAGWSDEQQEQLHGDGPQTEIKYRLAWARTYLKMMGFVDNSSRGVWTATESGRSANPEDVLHAWAAAASARQARRKTRTAPPANEVLSPVEAAGSVDDDTPPEDDPDEGWQDALLETMLALSPLAFEHLARRLLLEAGFLRATVTGRSGDGGIDGLGVYQLSLLSFPVFFQCKRYRGSVGPGAVRDFRGAMAGRGDKGLFITTGNFTADARSEASRDGAPPIDLIDGQRLCELLKQYELGVRTTTRQVEDVSVDRDFWTSLSPS